MDYRSCKDIVEGMRERIIEDWWSSMDFFSFVVYDDEGIR